MPKLGPIYSKYKPNNQKYISGYRICISKRHAENAGFKIDDMLNVTSEKGKIIIERGNNVQEITSKDIKDGKIYLHAVTLMAHTLYSIVIDDRLFKMFLVDSKTSCGIYVDTMARRNNISTCVYSSEQEEYIKRFSVTAINFIFGSEEMIKEIKDKREKYKKSYLPFGEYIIEYELELLKYFDKLWTQDKGKIREDTPNLRRKEGEK